MLAPGASHRRAGTNARFCEERPVRAVILLALCADCHRAGIMSDTMGLGLRVLQALVIFSPCGIHARSRAVQAPPVPQAPPTGMRQPAQCRCFRNQPHVYVLQLCLWYLDQLHAIGSIQMRHVHRQHTMGLSGCNARRKAGRLHRHAIDVIGKVEEERDWAAPWACRATCGSCWHRTLRPAPAHPAALRPTRVRHPPALQPTRHVSNMDSGAIVSTSFNRPAQMHPTRHVSSMA